MVSLYACPICGVLDPDGISGHASYRCKGVHEVPKYEQISAKVSEQKRVRAKYGSKDKEARKAYRREWMRKKRGH